MKLERCTMDSFAVMGREGSTDEGSGFIGRLWQEADAHFCEIAHLAKRDEGGAPAGMWGAMSDMSRSFAPWENGFSRGLYLAGVECAPDAQPPAGWTKWILPASEYIFTVMEDGSTFAQVIAYMKENGLPLAGAAYDFHCPQTGLDYIFFPIRRL